MTAESIQFFMRKATRDCRRGWKAMSALSNNAKSEGCEWPNWCLIPEEGWKELISTYAKGDGDKLRMLTDILLLPALGAWRLTKGVYRFNEHIRSEILSTELPRDIPVSVLKRLPEWCVYIELEGILESDVFSEVKGAWVRLGHHVTEYADILVILIEDGELLRRYLCPISVSSISEMVESSMWKSKHTYGEDPACMETLGSSDARRELLTKVINALLYICSSEPDIEDHEEPDAKPTRARMQRMGKRDMFVAADRVRIWNVGDKVGEMIRNYNEDPADRKHTRRHLRRAHWHGYWTGRRGSDEREFSYKWLSPMVVGVSA